MERFVDLLAAPPFRGPSFPESARNVSPNKWISQSGRKKDHLLKVFVLW